MDWLSGFRIFHLSSFLDDRSPAALSELIARAKQRNPSLLLSLDPGAHWARSCANDREVMNLLEACDILFVNPEEYQALSACAALDRVKAVVFCKRPESVLVYRQSSASKRIHLELNIDRLPADRIVDTVGAGDVFAAGVLALLHDAPDDYERAAKGGLAAARRKLLAVSLQV
jgi:sugar/nucleoside kinase (ribokinase family)